MRLGPRVFLIRFSTAFAKPSSNHLSPKETGSPRITHFSCSTILYNRYVYRVLRARAAFPVHLEFLPSQAAVRRSIDLSFSGQVEDLRFKSACGDHRDSQPKRFGQTIVQLPPVPVPHTAVYEGIGCFLEVRRVRAGRR